MAARKSTEGDLVPSRIYWRVGAGLLGLTALTVGVSFIPLGGFNLVAALIIATAKALLVALFFMHLLYDNRFYMLIVVTALLTLMIFIILTLFDTLNRGMIYPEVGKPIQEQAIIYKQDSSRTDTIAPQPSGSQQKH